MIISPPVFHLQPPFVALLIQKPLLLISSIFFVMQMISTATLQPPTNGLHITMSVHVSTVVEIVVVIIAKNTVIKSVFCRTRLSFKKRRIANEVIVVDVLVVAKTIKVVGTMNGTSLEWQISSVLLMVEFIALMKFG